MTLIGTQADLECRHKELYKLNISIHAEHLKQHSVQKAGIHKVLPLLMPHFFVMVMKQ